MKTEALAVVRAEAIASQADNDVQVVELSLNGHSPHTTTSVSGKFGTLLTLRDARFSLLPFDGSSHNTCLGDNAYQAALTGGLSDIALHSPSYMIRL